MIMTTIEALRDHDYDAALRGFSALRADSARRTDPTHEIFRAACPTLDSLAAALNGLQAALDAEAEDIPASWGEPELPLDTTSLPLYGDEDADLGLDGAFSWDETRALVPENPRTGAAEWTVVPRWDLPGDDDE